MLSSERMSLEGGGKSGGGAGEGGSSSSHSMASPGNAGAAPFGTPLIGDELGEFGIDGPESASPGSGFAPGGYWHQMVKEETGFGVEGEREMRGGPPQMDELMGMADDECQGTGVRLPLDGDEAMAEASSRRWGGVSGIMVPAGSAAASIIKADPSPTGQATAAAATFSPAGPSLS